MQVAVCQRCGSYVIRNDDPPDRPWRHINYRPIARIADMADAVRLPCQRPPLHA
jgi:hypothetical protein